jgi:hypothetical protein
VIFACVVVSHCAKSGVFKSKKNKKYSVFFIEKFRLLSWFIETNK